MSVNNYQATFAIPQTGAFGGLAGHRYITIITDTLQAAMGIARTKTKHGEIVVGVQLIDTDVVVDSSAISGGD